MSETPTSDQPSRTEAITTVALYQPTRCGNTTSTFPNKTMEQIAERGNGLSCSFGPEIEITNPDSIVMILKIPREQVTSVFSQEALSQGNHLPVGNAVETPVDAVCLNVLPSESKDFLPQKLDYHDDIDKLKSDDKLCRTEYICAALAFVLMISVLFLINWIAVF